MDAIEIYVDRGDGNWTFLAVDTYPHYIDSTPLPSSVTSAVWKYKAIYRFDNAYVGM